MKAQIESALRLILLLSVTRLLVIVGLMGITTPSFEDLIFICIGLLAHTIVYPYLGFHLASERVLSNKGSFKPLKSWMVPGGKRELSGNEYKEFLDEEYSPEGMVYLSDIKSRGIITVLDVANMKLFESQYGKPSKYKQQDEALKENIKNSF